VPLKVRLYYQLTPMVFSPERVDLRVTFVSVDPSPRDLKLRFFFFGKFQIKLIHIRCLAPSLKARPALIGFVNLDQPLFHHSIKPSARATSSIGYVRIFEVIERGAIGQGVELSVEPSRGMRT